MDSSLIALGILILISATSDNVSNKYFKNKFDSINRFLLSFYESHRTLSFFESAHKMRELSIKYLTVTLLIILPLLSFIHDKTGLFQNMISFLLLLFSIAYFLCTGFISREEMNLDFRHKKAIFFLFLFLIYLSFQSYYIFQSNQSFKNQLILSITLILVSVLLLVLFYRLIFTLFNYLIFKFWILIIGVLKFFNPENPIKSIKYLLIVIPVLSQIVK